MNIKEIRHDWPEKAGYTVYSPEGEDWCGFVHFSAPVLMTLNGETFRTQPNACIFYSVTASRIFRFPQDTVQNWMDTDASISGLLSEYGIPENTLLYPGETSFISDIFRKTEREFFSDNPFRQRMMEAHVHEFLIRMARAIENSATTVPVRREDELRMREVRRQILSMPEKHWTVAEMASMAALSPSRFHAVYKSVYGTSPMQDIIGAKIHMAKAMLLSDEKVTLPIIAERLGYSDQCQLIRQFKAVTGETPGAFRKR